MLLNEKVYKVTVKNKDEVAKVVLRFLSCPHIYNKEVMVLNVHDKPVYDTDHIFPRNMFSAVYSENHKPTEEEVLSKLKGNDYLFNGVASFDKKDSERMTISSMSLNVIDNCLMFNPMGCKNKATINKIIEYLEGENAA